MINSRNLIYTNILDLTKILVCLFDHNTKHLLTFGCAQSPLTTRI